MYVLYLVNYSLSPPANKSCMQVVIDSLLAVTNLQMEDLAISLRASLRAKP